MFTELGVAGPVSSVLCVFNGCLLQTPVPPSFSLEETHLCRSEVEVEVPP